MKLQDNYNQNREAINKLYDELDTVRQTVEEQVKDNFAGKEEKTITVTRKSGPLKGKTLKISPRQLFDEFRHLGFTEENKEALKPYKVFTDAWQRLEQLETEAVRMEEELFGFTFEQVTMRDLLNLIDAVVEGKK